VGRDPRPAAGRRLRRAPGPDPRPAAFRHLDRSDLLLAQTCGLPFRRDLWGRVAYVATPAYDLPDCPAGWYRSALVARGAGNGGSAAALARREAGGQRARLAIGLGRAADAGRA
jgi:hypothetical protein